MTELDLQQRIKDEAFISSTAWVIMILAGIVLYWSLVGAGMAQLVWQAQGQAFANTPGSEISDIMAKIKQSQLRGLLFVGISAVGSLLLLVTTLAVLKRRRWGRILLTTALLLLVAINLFLVFYVGRQSYLELEEISLDLSSVDDDFSRSFNLGARLQYASYALFLLLLCWLMTRAAIKLNRPRIRALFS